MLINFIIDFIIVAIIAFGAFFGITKGFVASVAKPVRWGASIVIAFSLCTPFADAVIFPLLEEPITNQISDYLIQKCADITAANASDRLPTLLKIAATLTGVDITTIGEGGGTDFINQLVDKLAFSTIRLISVMLAFFAIYFLAKILLRILFGILDGILDSGVLGVFNRALGFIFSTAFAFISAWALVALFGYVINIPAFSDSVFASFEGGYIYRFFKGISPLDLLLSF